MKLNTFIIILTLFTLPNLYKTNYDTFISEIFEESSKLETIQNTIFIQFRESFLYTFNTNSLEFPQTMNEILKFELDLLETNLDNLDHQKIINKLSILIHNFKDELKQEETNYVDKEDLMENCLKAARNYFKNYNILQLKNNRENFSIMSDENISQAVDNMEKTIAPFNKTVLLEGLIKVNNDVFILQKPYFLDLLKIINSPDQVFDFILVKTFENSESEDISDNSSDMLLKLMNLFGTLILRDTAKNHTNRIKSICETLKKNLIDKKRKFENEFYRKLLSNVFQTFSEYFSEDEIEESLNLLLLSIFGKSNLRDKRLALIVDDIYEYNGLNYLNEKEKEIDSVILIKTLNTIRHISNKSKIKKKDYLKILKIVNFILEMEEKNKRVFIIDNYIELFDIKKNDIDNHRVVFESLFNLIMSFSGDIKVFNVEKKNTLLMNYIIYIQTHKLDLFTPLNIDIGSFGTFLQLWVYLHNVPDFTNYDIFFLKSKPVESPLSLLKERPKYMKFLNHWISNNETFGTYFNFKLLNDKIITKDITSNFFNQSTLDNYLI